MNVIVVPVASEGVISTAYSKKKGYYFPDPPKGGYFQVCWKRKHGKVKEITGLFSSRNKAEQFADILNSLSPKVAKMIVQTLHSRGRAMLADHQLKNPRYTGRSFDRPRL